jgi:hypothetical protein
LQKSAEKRRLHGEYGEVEKTAERRDTEVAVKKKAQGAQGSAPFLDIEN